jgi:hypothetical protein
MRMGEEMARRYLGGRTSRGPCRIMNTAAGGSMRIVYRRCYRGTVVYVRRIDHAGEE